MFKINYLRKRSMAELFLRSQAIAYLLSKKNIQSNETLAVFIFQVLFYSNLHNEMLPSSRTTIFTLRNDIIYGDQIQWLNKHETAHMADFFLLSV